MNNEQFVKYRALAVVVFGLIWYPTILLLATLTKIYQLFFGKPKCKPIAGDVAVVTGAGHGLGQSIAIELARKGCHVAVVDINEEGAINTAKFITEKFNVKSKAYMTDVSDYEQVVKLNEKITEDLGPATILVNNAAVLMFDNIKAPEPKQIQRMINVNLTAHFWTNRIFLPNMKRAKRGHITAISSASSLFPLIFNAEYTSTKFAVRGLMRVLRQELKYGNYHDINCTTFYPMFLQTNNDVVNIVRKMGFHKLYPFISGEEAAQRIVQAMVNNEEEVVMPSYFELIYRCFEILPAFWQDFISVAPVRTYIDKFSAMKRNTNPKIQN